MKHWANIERHRLMNEDPRFFEDMFRAKFDGSWCLAQLLDGRPDAALIIFSSVIGVFGATSYGAYAAANAFSESFTQNLRARGRKACCFHWSMWDDLGMAAGNPVATRIAAESQGYQVISPLQGIESLLAGMARDEASLIVGADASTPAVRARMRSVADPFLSLMAFYRSAGGLELVGSEALQVCDDLGTPLSVDLARVAQMPVNDRGEVDRPALKELAQHQITPVEVDRPRTPLESRIAAVWGQVLGMTRIGREDNFFGIGGDSIKAAVVVNRLQALLGVALPMATLFMNPTVAELAAHVGEHGVQGRTTESSDRFAMQANGASDGVARVARDRERASERAIGARADKKNPIPARQSEAEELLSRLDELSEEELEALIAAHSKPSDGHHA